MFLNDLYTINKKDTDGTGNKLSVRIQLNPSHPIFKGHFPGNPVLPGVCIVQIMKEILMVNSGYKLILNTAGSIKYLSVIDPQVNGMVNFDMDLTVSESERISCNLSVNFDAVVFCRFKGEFRII